jgi:hypothetical protein
MITRNISVEGGWKLYKNNVVKAYCYSSGARRFITPPSLQKCLRFCQKYRMQFCEYGRKDGFCYAKDYCTKMRQSTSSRVLNIYIFTKGMISLLGLLHCWVIEKYWEGELQCIPHRISEHVRRNFDQDLLLCFCSLAVEMLFSHFYARKWLIQLISRAQEIPDQ